MNSGQLLTIGMPVYNGAKTIQKALDSLLNQSFSEFKLIISDNASTDETGRICRWYALKDKRIEYIKQINNLGAEENFRFVFKKAKTPYFMWAAADDIRSQDFIEVNLTFLINNPSYVGSTSPVRFEGGEFDELIMGDAALADESPYVRMQNFFRGWHANARYYSLFRSEALDRCVDQNNFFLGGDWSLIIRLILIGKFHRSSNGWVLLGKEGVSHSADIFKNYQQGWIDIVLPFFRLSNDTLKLIKHASLKDKIAIIRKLVRLNIQAMLWQFKTNFKK